MVLRKDDIRYVFHEIRRDFQGGLTDLENRTEFQRWATTVGSTTSENKYPFLGVVPTMREWLGPRHIEKLKAHNYALVNRRFESTLEIKVDDIEDGNLGGLRETSRDLGGQASLLWNQLTYGLIERGESALGYDDVPLFSTAHPVDDESGDVQSNLTDGGSTPWYLIDDSRRVKSVVLQQRMAPRLTSKNRFDDDNVFMDDVALFGVKARGAAGVGLWQFAHKAKVDLTTSNFNDVYAAMMDIKTDNGRTLGVQPRLLVVPPSLRAAALEVIRAERLPNGASNTNFGAVSLLITPLLNPGNGL